MAENSAIQWTNHTWNPWHGCRKVSPGCAPCYMFQEKKQYGQEPTLVVKSKTKFRDPLKWKEPARVFTCSWSDWFIEEADAWRDEAWEIIRATPHLTYQILTKRIERTIDHLPTDWPLKNVWLGVSVEDQKRADLRIPRLLMIPATVRFLSVEPILGPVSLDRGGWLRPNYTSCQQDDSPMLATLARAAAEQRGQKFISWVIVGGESGPKARPCDVDSVRSIVAQCKAAGVPCFVKQLGTLPYFDVRDDVTISGARPHQFVDRKGGDPEEWPLDLRVREFPNVTVQESAGF